MLNHRLNIDKLRKRFAKKGYVSIPEFLTEDFAIQLEEALFSQKWYLEIKDYVHKAPVRMAIEDVSDPSNLLQALYSMSANLDQNRLFYMRLSANVQEFTSPALSDFNEFVNSEAFLNPIRSITSRPDARNTWIEASAYDRCCFLGTHRDDHHPRNLVALVLNLTRVWQVDWGGLLLIQHVKNACPIVLPPSWNTMNLFAIPVDHQVSCVSPAAQQKRYAMRGWLLS